MEDKFIYFLEKSGKLRNFYNLIDSKNYDEIYNLYGKNIFQKYTPVSVQKSEIERCFAEGDFETLRRKYGKLYNVHVKAYKTIEKIKLEKRGLFQKAAALGLAALTIASLSTDGFTSLMKDNSSSTSIVKEDSLSSKKSKKEEKKEEKKEDKKEDKKEEKKLDDLVQKVEEEVEFFEENDNSNYIYDDDNLSLEERRNYNLLVEADNYIESGKTANLYDDVYDLNNDNYLNTSYCAFYDMPFLANISLYNSKVEKWNMDLYSNYLDEYNAHLEEYAEKVRAMNLDDDELIARVLIDIWSSVEDGVGPGKYDIYGLFRVDIDKEHTSAVCRNFADDFTSRINAINPDMEAVNFLVNMDEAAYGSASYGAMIKKAAKYEADWAQDRFIDMPFDVVKDLKDNEGNDIAYKVERIRANNLAPENSYQVKVSGDLDESYYVGNHMVSMIAIKDKETKELKYHLLVDVSNLNISVLKDGKIYVLSNRDYEGLEICATGNIIFSTFDEAQYIADAVIDSRERTEEISLEEVSSLYDVQALNKKLTEMRVYDREHAETGTSLVK